MKWVRRAFYVLPVLILGLAILSSFALEPFGAECHGVGLDDLSECNDLGEAQGSIYFGGLLLTVLSVPIWAAGMLIMGVRAFLRRRRARLD